ncbi:NAD-dependent aldehyde dehydrogenase family protein [Rhizoctonia solani AG-3 Rhs1AP]|uniref:NAD-dependent aldehyde dehydrogenase family protein n=1 Tax=Rhizoctonia solani AG-3 Rhs1AP TaxID=1086054 RepID=X8JI20_9AGAM|nr:NAD-dependent aldehyde dehydrogenase family protein [Rhizoctonia solani AG-3 Rhs1AP]
MFDYTHIINGEALTSSRKMSVINPANLQKIAEVPVATKEQLDEAVSAARNAFPSWSAKSHEERAKKLFKMALVIEQNLQEYKQILTSEQGKTLADAEFELGLCVTSLRGTAQLSLPEVVLLENDEMRIVERRVAIGVVRIVPWNFPMILAILKLAPAILAGNTFILKPSPFTPLTSLKLVKDMQLFLPPGVVNILSGDDSLGPLITDHPGIDKISFTGSTETGKKVMAGASAGLKHLTLELGGKDPAIILPDVDPTKLASYVSKRIYVHEKIYDQFRDELVKYARAVKIGDGTDPNNQLGPVQNILQYQRVISFIEDSHAKKHKFALGGVASPNPTNGLFIPISIVDNPPDDSRIVREEPFGPIVPLMKWSDEAEVIRRANDTEYGLSASVWGKDMKVVERIARQIQAGTVCMNEFNPADNYSAFGGHKKSGLGVENGIHGLMSFTNIQSLTLKKNPRFL